MGRHYKWGLGRLVFEVSGTHVIRHTQPVGFLCMRDRIISEAATYTTNTRDEHPYNLSGIRTRIPSIANYIGTAT